MLGSTVSDSVNRWLERSVGVLMEASNPGGAAGPIRLAQLAFHDLADGAARKRVAELDVHQPLRFAELAVRPPLDLGFADRGALAWYAERHRRFAPLLARDADHGDVDNLGMPEQQHLDVG